MLKKLKFSTAVYLILLFLLVVWLVKSYFFDLNKINKELQKTSQQTGVPTTDEKKEELPLKYRRISDGIFVDSVELAYPHTTAIVLENITESRPQAGLDQASVVYEVSAEGGITRFLAIFDSADLSGRIGPIRSARPYFLDWSEEFGGPVFLHVGGSPEALNGIDSRHLVNLDEFFWRYDYYERVKDRRAPHNTYTTPILLQEIKDDYKLPVQEYESWRFKDEAEILDRGNIGIVKIDFSANTYDYENDYLVSWDYNVYNNNYSRKQGGNFHKTENDVVITAKNIIIMYTEENIVDDLGRLSIKTIGEGKAQVFYDGIKIDAIWKKENTTSRTRFYNLDGEELEFNAGKTWIEVVPNENIVIVTDENATDINVE